MSDKTKHGPESPFAQDVMQQKYSHVVEGQKETWQEIAHRVTKHTMKAVEAPRSLVKEIEQAIAERKFMPGGRYLYAAGRPLHQTQNCALFRVDDSREGWADLMQKVTLSLMTGAGIGVVYSDVRAEGKIIKKTGGTATGPCALQQMVNEAGRGIMQGGSRRSALWAGLHWDHPDVIKFIQMKNWSPEVRALKEKDFSFPATMDGTNISVILDDGFFDAYGDEKNPHHSHAHNVYWTTVRQMLKTAEPGFSVDIGKNKGENLRNAPICAGTAVLTAGGYRDVVELLGGPTTIWTGKRWARDVVFQRTSLAAKVVRVSIAGGREIRCDEDHPFLVERYRGAGHRRRLESIVRVPAKDLAEGDILHVSLPEVVVGDEVDVDAYALGYIYGDGTFNKNGNADVTFCTEASKSCVERVRSSSRISSVNESDGRGYIRAYFKVDHSYWDRAKDVFPVEMYGASAATAASFLAGLFDADGNWEPTQKRIRLASKHEGFLRGVARLLEQLGILSGVSKGGISTYGHAQGYQLVVMADYACRFARIVPTMRVKPLLEGYIPYRQSTLKVQSVEEDGIEPVYCADVQVEEHSFQAEGVIISNCCEITSRDDSDICNLGSINLARVESVEEMAKLVELGAAFLLAGTVYSDVPFAKIDQIRTKNRRLGLGLMGVHEWLLKRGRKYGPDEELEQWLKVYAKSSEYAHKYADEWELSKSLKTRAIAPNGTISIVAETTSGIEPVYCVAYKRRYLKGNTFHHQYVVDPAAQRLIDAGVSPESIEDAYDLAADVERRVAFQAWVQKHVDHAISSTINLPSWGSELNNEGLVRKFGDMLMKYLPQLRGITCYPEGARGGQPLTPVKHATAVKHVGEIFLESTDLCDITGKGSCGS